MKIFTAWPLIWALLVPSSLISASTTSNNQDITRKTLYWPSGSGAPYSKVSFSETICSCREGLNLTKYGCYNVTDGTTMNQSCVDKPYWGLVFIWWAVAAFLLGGATTTSFGIISDVWKTIWVYGIKRRPNSNQVVDINWTNDQDTSK